MLLLKQNSALRLCFSIFRAWLTQTARPSIFLQQKKMGTCKPIDTFYDLSRLCHQLVRPTLLLSKSVSNQRLLPPNNWLRCCTTLGTPMFGSSIIMPLLRYNWHRLVVCNVILAILWLQLLYCTTGSVVLH